jgi:tRNA(fMet)-specific endonuclease VapC
VFAFDANTISYYFRSDPQVVPRMHALPPARMSVPGLVVHELSHWAALVTRNVAEFSAPTP